MLFLSIWTTLTEIMIEWVAYKWEKKLFLTVLGAGKSKMKAPADSVLGEGLLLDSQMAIILLWPHMVEGAGKFSGVPFNKGTNSIHKGTSRNPQLQIP